MLRLAKELKIPWPHAVGIIELLFHATARYAPRGNIGKCDDRWIAATVGWKQRPEKLISALILVGWLDRDPEHRLLVHDWSDHADQSVRKTLKYQKTDFVAPTTAQLVYFIRATHSGLIKIGVTGRLDASRLQELQANALEPLELLSQTVGGYSLEARLAERFGGDRVRGEWYKPSEDLMNVINYLPRYSPENIHTFPASRAPAEPDPLPLPLPSPLPLRARTNGHVSVDAEALSERLVRIWKKPGSPLYLVQQYLADRLSDGEDANEIEAGLAAWAAWYEDTKSSGGWRYCKVTLAEAINDRLYKTPAPKRQETVEEAMDRLTAEREAEKRCQ